MPIEHGKGGTMLTGDSISFFQLAAQRGAVKLELVGIKVRRGPVLWRQLRDHYQIPGTGKRKATHQQVYDWLDAKVTEMRAQQTHISTEHHTDDNSETHKCDARCRTIVEVEGREVN